MTGPWEGPSPAPGPEPVLAHIRFRVTPADVAAAWRAHLRWRYLRPTAMTVPVLLGLALAVFEAVLNPGESAALLAVPLLGIPALAVAARLLHYAAVPLLARRTWRQTRAYQEEWSVDLTEAGTRARAASLDNFVPWTHYVAWSETSRVVLLYHNDMLFQFVPRAAVDPATTAVFHSLVAGLPKRA